MLQRLVERAFSRPGSACLLEPAAWQHMGSAYSMYGRAACGEDVHACGFEHGDEYFHERQDDYHTVAESAAHSARAPQLALRACLPHKPMTMTAPPTSQLTPTPKHHIGMRDKDAELKRLVETILPQNLFPSTPSPHTPKPTLPRRTLRTNSRRGRTEFSVLPPSYRPRPQDTPISMPSGEFASARKASTRGSSASAAPGGGGSSSGGGASPSSRRTSHARMRQQLRKEEEEEEEEEECKPGDVHRVPLARTVREAALLCPLGLPPPKNLHSKEVV